VREFAGRYLVEATLGRGSFGEVHRARDQELGRLVAVKVLRADVTEPEVRARFEREARLAASVEHPNLVRLLDHGHTPGGAPFLVFEFVEGSSLEDRLDRAFTPAQWVSWVRDVAAGLVALHEAGVVHRDLKPANVLVHQDGRAMLADLGLARVEEATCDGLTATGALVGTPLYMAPELFSAGGMANPEADLFSLGCLAYRGLYGRDWRDPGSFGELMAGGPGEAAAPPVARFGRFPEADVWLRGLLHPDPAARLGPAARVVEAIEGGEAIPEGTLEGTSAPSPVSPISTAALAPVGREPAGRRGWVVGAVLVVAVGVIVGLTSGPEDPGPGPGPGPKPGSAPVLGEDAVAEAKQEVWRRAGELPLMDRTIDKARSKRIYQETQVDYRTPLKFKRCLGAIQELMALGYLPRDDDTWYPRVVFPIQKFLGSIADIGPPRIAGAVLEVGSLQQDQSFREKMNAIQVEVRTYGLEFVDAAARGGRIGRHWREDYLLMELSRHATTSYGETFRKSFLAGLEAEREVVWRACLLDGLVKLTRLRERFGLDYARGEQLATAIVSWAATRLGDDLQPAPLMARELTEVVAAELYLRHRRALRGERDEAADARCERVVDLVLLRADSEQEHFGLVDNMLDDLEGRLGVPKGSDLDDAQVAGLQRLRDRLAETVEGRVKNF
jgi:serine/threonine-protein kinase